MIKRLLAVLAAAAAVAGAAAVPATAHTHPPKVTAGPAGFLQDDGGSGYALSPQPGQPIGDSSPMATFPVSSAWRLNQNTAGGQCNSGRVSYGVLDCPWTGSAVFLDKAYDGDPIFEYAVHADPSMCAARVVDLVALHTCSSRPVQLWVAANITGGGYVLNVAASQSANGRKLLCGNGSTIQASVVSPGACTAGHRSWVFTQPVR